MQRRGASLAELVVATLVLGAALIPIYSIFTNSSKTAGASKYAYLAAQVARETIEELRQVPFDKLEELKTTAPTTITGPLFATTSRMRAVGGATDPNGVATASSPSYPEDYKRIKRTINVEPVDGTGLPQAITGVAPKPRLKKITLDVFWEEQGGVAEKTRPGLQHYVTFIGYHGVDPEVPE